MNMLARSLDFHREDADAPFAGDIGVYKTLLESTRAIPWKIDWATMRFAYIGPQIEDLLGWPRDSWVTVEDWSSRIHEGERDASVNFCVAQSMAGADHEMDYRALTRDGGYVWMRDVVHVVRKEDGEVDCLIGFMFDISERKKAEEDLLRLQEELEHLSFTDGLTGLSNRRLFDRQLEREWKASRRSGLPLSLILLDVDYFKQFNDTYGHVSGDDCLKQIGTTLLGVGRRPRDVVARLGGEEIAMILPETGEAEAKAMGRDAMDRIAALHIPHERSDVAPHVTVSLGVCTVLSTGAAACEDALEAADSLLYAAKKKGRNRMETALFEG